MCARHGAVLGGASPLSAVEIGRTSLDKDVHREVESVLVGENDPKSIRDPANNVFPSATSIEMPPNRKRMFNPTTYYCAYPAYFTNFQNFC